MSVSTYFSPKNDVMDMSCICFPRYHLEISLNLIEVNKNVAL